MSLREAEHLVQGYTVGKTQSQGLHPNLSGSESQALSSIELGVIWARKFFFFLTDIQIDSSQK